MTAHEGRHRAAAVRRDAPGERLAVSINLRYDGSSRYYEEGGPPRYEKTFFGISRIPQTLTPQSQDWAARYGMDESEARIGTIKLGMDEFKDALEPWRMTS